MMFTCHELLLQFTCNIQLHVKKKFNIFFTAIIHIPHCTAQIINSGRAGVFTGRCFNLFTSNA